MNFITKYVVAIVCVAVIHNNCLHVEAAQCFLKEVAFCGAYDQKCHESLCGEYIPPEDTFGYCRLNYKACVDDQLNIHYLVNNDCGGKIDLADLPAECKPLKDL